MAALGVVAAPRPAAARDYASAAEVLDTIDGLATEVEAGLAAIVQRVPGAASFIRFLVPCPCNTSLRPSSERPHSRLVPHYSDRTPQTSGSPTARRLYLISIP